VAGFCNHGNEHWFYKRNIFTAIAEQMLTSEEYVTFQVLTAANIKMAVFRVVALCSQSGRSLPTFQKCLLPLKRL
jgi:hypothetical protein